MVKLKQRIQNSKEQRKELTFILTTGHLILIILQSKYRYLHFTIELTGSKMIKWLGQEFSFKADIWTQDSLVLSWVITMISFWASLFEHPFQVSNPEKMCNVVQYFPRVEIYVEVPSRIFSPWSSLFVLTLGKEQIITKYFQPFKEGLSYF